MTPATVMRDFFHTFLDSSTKVLLLISCLVTVVRSSFDHDDHL